VYDLAAFMGYYNWRVTGNALLLPQAFYRRVYWDVPLFVWQPVKPAVAYDDHQFTSMFEVATKPAFVGRSWVRQALTKCHWAWGFFLHETLTIPFLTLPWLIFDRRIRFLMLQFAWCGVWLLLVYWFEPHYAAPLTASIFIIVSQAIRHLREWKFGSYRVGVWATRVVVVVAIAGVFLPNSETINGPRRGWNLSRAQIAERLEATPQKHLILVREGPERRENGYRTRPILMGQRWSGRGRFRGGIWGRCLITFMSGRCGCWMPMRNLRGWSLMRVVGRDCIDGLNEC